MLLKFRSRGCLITAFLVGLMALLSCGGLFLLVTPRPAPDALAELKQVPLYAGAQEASYSPVRRTPDSPNEEVSAAALSFDTFDDPQRVLDFYVGELNEVGWSCSFGAMGAVISNTSKICRREDQGFSKLVFRGFQPAQPWVEISTPMIFRTAFIDAYKSKQGKAETYVSIDYFLLIR
ncbi:MAG TPA: hypothetical protein VF826_03810 [Chloroflexia bacterium]|jgi:hypothetical protein